jgi:tyrosyl-tRNA synthetase
MVKAELAKLIIRDIHSPQAAVAAEQEFNRIFKQKMDPEDIEERRVRWSDEKIRLAKLIAQFGLATSASEAHRLIEQGAVTWNNERVSNTRAELDCSVPTTHILKVGKLRFVKVIVESNSRPQS